MIFNIMVIVLMVFYVKEKIKWLFDIVLGKILVMIFVMVFILIVLINFEFIVFVMDMLRGFYV